VKVLFAGASGTLGRALVPQLLGAGHEVIGLTLHPLAAERLRALGVRPITVDVFDRGALLPAVRELQADAVLHQLTALADFRNPDKWFAVTNRLRTEGTDHLLAAAQATGVPHVVAQGYASWNGIRQGGWVKTEDDPLDPETGTIMGKGAAAIRHLESAVLDAGGAVLRYGAFYGPGATDDQVAMVRKRQFPLVGGGAGYCSWVHLDDAASATVLAVEQKAKGVFNIVDDEPAPAAEWLPHLAAVAGAKPPMRVPKWLARLLAGDLPVIMMLEGRGFSNAKAKRELGWELRYPSWRQGFKKELA